MNIAYLPENTTTVPFWKIDRLIADALYPDGHNQYSPNYTAWLTSVRWAMNDLQLDADSGKLKVRNKFTNGIVRLCGDKWSMLEHVVVTVTDLKHYLAEREITLAFGVPEVALRAQEDADEDKWTSVQNLAAPSLSESISAYKQTAVANPGAPEQGAATTDPAPAPSPGHPEAALKQAVAHATLVATLVGPAEAELADKRWVMKKAALLSKHVQSWPTIARDFQDASENGLSKAAKAPGRGNWFESDVLNWGDQRGKRTSEKPHGSANSVFNLARTKHTTGD